MTPLGWVGEHRVHVTEKAERGAVAGAFEVGDEVGAARIRGEQLGFESGLSHVVGEVLDRRALLAWRIHRVEPNEPLKHLGRLALKPVRGHLR